MEKIYKTMRNTGAASIAVGVIVASVGLAAGIIAIVNGFEQFIASANEKGENNE